MEEILKVAINDYQNSINKPIKESSIKIYVSNVRSLRKKMKIEGDFDNIDFVKDYDKVMETLSDLQFTTQRNYMNALIVAMYSMSDFEPDIRVKYEKKRDEFNKMYEDNLASGIVSASQSENYLPHDEIKKVVNDLWVEVKPIISRINKDPISITIKQRNSLQMFVLLSIYLKYPFRNEVVDLEQISRREYNKLTDNQKAYRNMLITEQGNMAFSMNDYKTSRKYKEKMIKVDKPERLLLEKWIKLNGGNPMFMTQSTLKKLTRNELSQMFMKFFKDKTGKSISTTLLAKSLLTATISPEQADKLKKSAQVRGHTVDTALKIYVMSNQPIVAEQEKGAD
tara:strand:- start:576 stop:1592 length:1017 start_codon:yes stop_codon:yes gene_type:complete